MYNHFFGLQREPFAMAPDPSFLFLTPSHREALAGLTYAVLHRKGFVVLTGDAGTGKTTLLTRVLESLPSTTASVSVILNPTLTPAEFLEMVLLEFGVTHVPASKTQRLMKLHHLLMGARSLNRAAVLVVDEAQRLSPDVLEELRLLSNFELADGKLLQIVLAGQTELADALNREDLRQLKQRIAVRLNIRPLSEAEVDHYIRHRWAKAGAKGPSPFTQEAVAHVARFSRGIPRLVNTLCDNSLLLAYGEDIRQIDVAQVSEAAHDLDLAPPMPVLTARNLVAASRPVSADVIAMPTLDRYAPTAQKRSLLSRWMGKRAVAAGRTPA
jgi:general secretion pathway protein A